MNEAGLRLLKEFEGCKLKSYLCSADRWTVGWGATGEDIGPDTVWTQDEADQRLQIDLERFESGVKELVKVHLNDNQISALVCFAYNVGLESLKRSTLLKYVNQGMHAAVGLEFPKWQFAGGVALRGLKRRRLAEKSLYEMEQ